MEAQGVYYIKKKLIYLIVLMEINANGLGSGWWKYNIKH